MSASRVAKQKGRPPKDAAPPEEMVHLTQLTKDSYRCSFDGCNAVIVYRQNARRHVQDMHLKFLQSSFLDNRGR